MFLRFGPRPIVLVFGYKKVHEVLVDNASKTKHRPTDLYLIKKFFPTVAGKHKCGGAIFSQSKNKKEKKQKMHKLVFFLHQNR